jgi:hypothetical protein
VIQNTSDFAKQGTNPLGTFGDLNVEKLLHSQGEALLVRHHRDIIQTVKVGQGLHIRLVLDQFLSSTVQETDMGIGANNLFAIEFQNQSQHSVRSRMLRAKVDGIVPNLATANLCLGLQSRSLVGVFGGAFVCEMGEGRICRNDLGRLVRLRLCSSS